MMGPSKEPLKNHDIDSTGDVVGTLVSADDDNIELSTLRLSSKIPSLVSPVFKSMLDPAKGLKESLLKPNGMKEICITAFSEKSTIVAMNIFHYQPESLPGPTEVSSRELYNLASFADYYQCQRFLKLWAPIWAMPIWRIRSPSKNTARWLWIGISFQIPQVTKDCAQEVFERMRLQGGKFVVDGKPFHNAMKYTDVIWHQREKYIQQFTEKVESQYCNFENESKRKGVASRCDLIQLGTRKFLRLKTALPKCERDEMTFKEIFSMLRGSAKVGKYSQKIHKDGNALRDTVKHLTDLVTKLENIVVKKTLLSAFGISDNI
ncbi:hypothetical protein TWF103_003351 [Orbilia oligospora]|nr:hypothetical protein TWF103_003351 [Orbilia oligospora]